MKAYGFTTVALALALSGGCATPCSDDGLGQKDCPNQSSDADSQSGSGTETGTDSNTDSDSDSGSGSATSTSGASDSATGGQSTCNNGVLDGDETDVDCGGSCPAKCEDGEVCQIDADCLSLVCDPNGKTCTPSDCSDGVQNGDETDVDCGGSCQPCPDGKVCEVEADCLSLACVEQTCGDPVCKDDELDNTCQGCLKANCCDKLVECFQDEFCTCWFNCIQHNNDFEPCKIECMGNSSPGSVTSCANSQCNYEGACGK